MLYYWANTEIKWQRIYFKLKSRFSTKSVEMTTLRFDVCQLCKCKSDILTNPNVDIKNFQWLKLSILLNYNIQSHLKLVYRTVYCRDIPPDISAEEKMYEITVSLIKRLFILGLPLRFI